MAIGLRHDGDRFGNGVSWESRVLGRNHVTSQAVSCRGQDESGELYHESMVRAGVNLDLLQAREAATGTPALGSGKQNLSYSQD
jgi:sugar/nucleoside kinase (ribokinase family)